MTFIQRALAEPVVQALGWSLVHFLWQGILVAFGLACVLALMRRASANSRYIVCCVALLLMAALPAATTTKLMATSHGGAWKNTPTSASTGLGALQKGAASSATQAHETAASETAATPRSAPAGLLPAAYRGLVQWKERIAASCEPLIPWVVPLWLGGVVLFSLWNLGGWIHVQRLTRRGITGTGEEWRRKLKGLCKSQGLTRPVRLLQSVRVTAPAVIGWLRPVILLPAAALAGLTPEQLHALLAHEVAHIRRHDYAVNLVQTAIVTLLFYHPAVWWLSRRIRDEREHCCDDLAVTACGDSALYARALTALEELRAAPGPLAMAASGGTLFTRVRRIVGAPVPRTQGPASWIGVTLVLLLVFGMGLNVRFTVAESVRLDDDKAELMGRVENFFLNNYRDISARKSVEWGEVENEENGNRSIRYRFDATIWDKDVMLMNKVFTFDSEGQFVKVTNVPGYPREKEEKIADTTTKEGMIDLVDDFFRNNFRDITARETIEWGEVETLDNGNASIRYRYNATIWDKEEKIINQIFTFNPEGKFVSVEDVADSAQEVAVHTVPYGELDLSTPESTFIGFLKGAAVGNAGLAQSYFLPGGVDYDDIREVLTAEPGSDTYTFRAMMESIDPEVPMKVLSKTETEKGLVVVVQATFGKAFEIEGVSMEAGSTYDFDATLRETDHGWLIDNF